MNRTYILQDEQGDYEIKDNQIDSFRIIDTVEGSISASEHHKSVIIMKKTHIPEFIKILQKVYSGNPDDPFKNITIKWKI